MSLKNKKVENRVKQNFIKHIKNKPYKFDDKWKTDFHFSINSKAFFGLSEQAFKLYCLLILQGKHKFTSLNLLASRAGKSVRQIQRVKEELEINGFLKIVRIRPTTYQYIFDYTGRLNDKKKEVKPVEDKIEFVEKEVITETNETILNILEESKERVEARHEDEDQLVLEKAKTIVEYSDFAILNNKFWSLKDETKNKIKDIIKNRLDKEKENKDQLEWLYDRII